MSESVSRDEVSEIRSLIVELRASQRHLQARLDNLEGPDDLDEDNDCVDDTKGCCPAAAPESTTDLSKYEVCAHQIREYARQTLAEVGIKNRRIAASVEESLNGVSGTVHIEFVGF